MANPQPQQNAFDPNVLLALVQAMGDQKLQQIDTALKPRGRIAESPKNRPRYDVMADPNYKPFNNVPSWRDQPGGPVGRITPPDYSQAAPQQSGGLLGLLGGLFGQQKAPGPHINPLTGLPMGTMPGDPAYVNQQIAAGAPRAIPVADPLSPQAFASQPRDPQIQNAIDLSLAMRGFQAANPQMSTVPGLMFNPVQDNPTYSFDPGPTPHLPGLRGFMPKGQAQAQPAPVASAAPAQPKLPVNQNGYQFAPPPALLQQNQPGFQETHFTLMLKKLWNTVSRAGRSNQ